MDGHLQCDAEAQRPKRRQCRGRPPVDSLIDRFPVEIASRIFSFIIDDPDTTDTWIKKQTKGPLILGAVNRTWRAIAWTTPQLWAFIHIKISRKTIALRTELTKEWLARSGQLPLTIVVSWMKNQMSGASLAMDPLIDSINAYANRWRSLEVKLPFTSLSRLFSNPGPQSQLEVLKISCFPYHLATTDGPIFANVNLHPQRVQLLYLPLASINLRWDNMTHLDVDEPFIDQCLEILSHAPHLQYCTFSDVAWRGEGFPIPNSPITLSVLRELFLELSLDLISLELQPLLLNALVLPSLEQLTLDIEQHTLQGPLLSLIGRSSWPLRKLYLTLWGIDLEAAEDELVEVLHALPSLQEFELNGCDINIRIITDHFLARLNFPQLQIFNYTGIRFFSWEGLTVFATGFHSSGSDSRPQTMCIRLQNLEDGYIEEDYINKESLNSLILLRNTGLDITITAQRVGTNYGEAKVKPELGVYDILELSKNYHDGWYSSRVS